MALVKEVLGVLNRLSPFELQELWDNSGLNVGSENHEFSQIIACLEITLKIALNAPKNALIITHHPLIFKPLKTLNDEAYPGNILKILIQKDISVISMHTNFDKTHLNKHFASALLGFDGLMEKGLMLVKENANMEFDALVKKIKSSLGVGSLACVKSSQTIKDLAFVCGSGASMFSSLKAQSCLVTGDVKYHDAMIAQSLNISLIDATHYYSERGFALIMAEILHSFNYLVTIENFKNPLQII
ncbi:Nif3-like dinuclear metal center hexameric protein [Helicobacter pylori]|uniref:GTP cyclohydrolase I n=1 Tax=Helicobacter pylori TaxID=210 RepID=UPI000EAED397|nr:Nif3-like dinuclear metal center hexameric protein [Helicobacter pylori]TPH93769.1 Nif3-like dinuclear metal center hexameric protein [Helicobacter pylori]